MSMILIQNPGELPIWGMRLLGLSNKTADQIGQFGTGLKESIALLTRLGYTPIIFSGTNRIEFSVQELDEQQEVCFKMSETKGRFAADEWHGLGIHPNFGQADWDDPWMVFRELICNAFDEGGVDSLYHDIVTTEPEGKPGATRVYLPNDAKLMAAYATIGDRLLMLGDNEIKSVFDSRTFTLAKRRNKTCQIFHRDVWVQEDSRPSLFDYNINKLKLNESRSADWYDVNYEVAKAMTNWPVEAAQLLIGRMINDKEDGTKLYEASLLNNVNFYANSVESKPWKDAFHALFGSEAVMTDNDAFFYDKLRNAGFKPVIVNDAHLRAVLRSAGVREPNNVLTEEQRDWEDVKAATTEQRSMFDKVWNKLYEAGLTRDKTKPEMQVFTPRDGESVTFGQYKDGVCRISSTCIGSRHERLACIEEIAHHVTGADDMTRDFQTFLVGAIETLLFEKKEVTA